MPVPASIDEIAKLHDTEILWINFPANPKMPRREDFNSHADYGKALDEYESIKTQQRTTTKELQRKIYEIDAKYEAMVFEYLGINDHPKRGAAWSIAWQDRHSEGFRAVAMRLEELVEIM